jgi:hypothetical protein
VLITGYLQSVQLATHVLCIARSVFDWIVGRVGQSCFLKAALRKVGGLANGPM